MTKLFISRLPYDTSTSDLENMFVSFGKVLKTSIVKDPVTGAGKGCGYIEMDQEKDALQAIAELHHCIIDNQKITVLIVS